MALLGDFGTTWTKLLDTDTGQRRVLPSRQAHDITADIATGHNAHRRAPRHINELVALAQGGERLIQEPEFLLLDVGSREVKYVHMRGGELIAMDWTATCGSLTGFTLELLGRYYGLDYSTVRPSKKSVPVTCGVLGMEQLFELVAQGVSESEAVARFARGVALNSYRLIGEPGRFYLSGGMCDNRLFQRSFPDGVEVCPLGRFVLVEGLLCELERLPTQSGALSAEPEAPNAQ
jgi:activator of 2-hydroxyglutaryl-CoA dehydratase